MTANLRLARGRRTGFRLETKVSKRAGYVLALAILGAGMALGMEPARDLAPARAPWTILYIAAMAACLLGALSDRVVTVRGQPRELCVARRIAGVAVRREAHEVPDGAVVRLRHSRRPAYLLEIETGDTAILLDSSSWKSELDPMGKETARVLGATYES